jgi:hypothetical protein
MSAMEASPLHNKKALSGAERQRRWRDKRNELAQVLVGNPKEVADAILRKLGVSQGRKVVRALDKRLRNIKPGCPACQGTGFAPVRYSTACGMPLWDGKMPCDCGELAAALLSKSKSR